MDYSQYIRRKNEAANVYVARMKTVDSSFLTLQKQQKTAYSGYNDIQAIPYFNGSPVLNNAFVKNTDFDVSGSKPKYNIASGYTDSCRLSQQQDLASRRAGAVLCGGVDYSTAPPGNQLLNLQEQSTILTEYNNNMSAPGEWKPYGYGIKKFFPEKDTHTNDVYPPAAWPYH